MVFLTVIFKYTSKHRFLRGDHDGRDSNKFFKKYAGIRDE